MQKFPLPLALVIGSCCAAVSLRSEGARVGPTREELDVDFPLSDILDALAEDSAAAAVGTASGAAWHVGNEVGTGTTSATTDDATAVGVDCTLATTDDATASIGVDIPACAGTVAPAPTAAAATRNPTGPALDPTQSPLAAISEANTALQVAVAVVVDDGAGTACT
jgi:hypothetical protein